MAAPYLKRADNGVWYIHWTKPDGRSLRKSTKEREQQAAERMFGSWLIDVQRDTPSVKAATVAKLWPAYAASTPSRTTDATWRALKPFFGDRIAANIDQRAIDAYLVRRKVASPTLRRELAQLLACLRFHGLAVAVKRPPDGLPRDRWLTTAEIDRLLLARTTPRVRLFIWLALETAGRREALMDLTWAQVDFETRVIHLARPDRPQTKKRRASVPISDRLLPVLIEAFQQRNPFDPRVVGGVTITAQVRDAGARAGVRDVTPHVLRHTAATHMARRGVSLFHVAKVLGNSQAIVERVYAKHCPEDLRDAVNSISGR
jgi:integrase